MVTWGVEEPLNVIERDTDGNSVNVENLQISNNDVYYENMIENREPREYDEITPIRKVSTQDQLMGLNVSHKSGSLYDDPKHRYMLYPKLDRDVHKSLNNMLIKKRENYQKGNTKWIHAEGRLQYLRNDSQNPLNLMM